MGSGHPTPEKSQTIGFLSNTGPCNTTKLPQASIQCWARILTPAERHLNGFFYWPADDGPLVVVFGSSLPSSTKLLRKQWPKLDPLYISVDLLYRSLSIYIHSNVQHALSHVNLIANRSQW